MLGASPSDGSSKRTSLGRDIRARAIASICCSPPDKVPAICWRRSARIGKRSKSALQVGRDRGRVAAQIAAHLQILGDAHMREDAPALRAMRDAEREDAARRRARDVLALEMMRPTAGRMRPEIVRRVVVLPAPFAPMRVTSSPRRTSSESSRTAATLP